MLARHQRRHERVARRQIERADGGAERGQHVDGPDDGQAAERQDAKRRRDYGRGNLREQHQPPAIPRVGDHPADQRKNDDRHDADKADEAERERFPIRRDQQRDVPKEGRVLHHRAGERHEETDPDQTEVAVPERDERSGRNHECPSVGCGR
jgi:hypothetical protein